MPPKKKSLFSKEKSLGRSYSMRNGKRVYSTEKKNGLGHVKKKR